MQFTEGAFVFNLLSVGLMSVLITSVFLNTLQKPLNDSFALISARGQKRVLWAFVSTPWLVGLLAITLISFSEEFRYFAKVAHWHHLYVFDVGSWHGAALIIFSLLTFYVIYLRASSALRQISNLKILNILSGSELEKNHVLPMLPSKGVSRDIMVVDSKIPSAFSAGFLCAKSYITTGLLSQISKTEYDIIIAHEKVHTCNRDSLQKCIFAVFASLFSKNVSKHLNKSFSTSCELLADAETAKSHCSFEIAQTLIKAAKLQRSYFLSSQNLVNHFVDDDIDIRVRALVTPNPYRYYPWFCYGIGFCLILVTSLSVVDTLHHIIDSFFSH